MAAYDDLRTIDDVADRIDPRAAQLAIARIMAALGARDEWPIEAVEWAAGEANSAVRDTVIPSCSDQSADVVAFWSRIAEADQ